MKNNLRRYVGLTLFCSVTLGAPAGAQATVWNVVESLTGNSSFLSSLFHTSSGANPMSGTSLLNFTTTTTSWSVTSGTFDDGLGTLDVTFQFVDGTDINTITISNGSDFDFSGTSGQLNSGDGHAEFDVAFVLPSFPTLSDGSNPDLTNGTMTFLNSFQCCSGPSGERPNSFNAATGEMSLWGASMYNYGLDATNGVGLDNFTDSDARFGIDMRLKLLEVPQTNPVPIPAALPLFAGGLGLLGLLGWRRRRGGSVA